MELNLPRWKGNKYGKYMSEIIGTTSVNYVFYSGGTVDVHARCSNNPFKLENEDDVNNIIAFFGQIRDRLITFLMDRHERIVPPIMFWELSECDLNRDIKVTHLLHITGIKIQVKHLSHLFRIYIKSMGEDTVCRVEENIQPKKAAVVALNEIFNPAEKVVKQLQEINRKIDSALLKRRIDRNENDRVEILGDDERGGAASHVSHYDDVLIELRQKGQMIANRYIVELYDILRNEEKLLPEDCRAKIEHDLRGSMV